jgi:membrane protease YdiL (CAAX protease family)
MNEQQEMYRTEPPPRRIQLAEVCVFLFLIVPSMILSVPVVQKGMLNFSFVAAISILQDLALLSLILFFVWRNAEGLRSLGLSAANGIRELLLGILLYIPFTFFVRLLAHALQLAGIPLPQKPPMFLIPHNPAQTVLAIVFLVVVAVTEETLFRGYLLLRFRQLLTNTPAAVFLSAVIFSIGHGYQGVAGVIAVGTMGVVFALIYLWRQSLLAVMMIHFLQDFMAMIVGPAVMGK